MPYPHNFQAHTAHADSGKKAPTRIVAILVIQSHIILKNL